MKNQDKMKLKQKLNTVNWFLMGLFRVEEVLMPKLFFAEGSSNKVSDLNRKHEGKWTVLPITAL